jgi:hypothetical protein
MGQLSFRSGGLAVFGYQKFACVGTSRMNDNRHMCVAMQRLVDFISMVTQQYVTMEMKKKKSRCIATDTCNDCLLLAPYVLVIWLSWAMNGSGEKNNDRQ